MGGIVGGGTDSPQVQCRIADVGARGRPWAPVGVTFGCARPKQPSWCAPFVPIFQERCSVSSFEAESDVTGTIARLFVYPVKSCAGIEVQEALLTETGLDLDRAWMVVDAQRPVCDPAQPCRAWRLIRPQLKSD